MISLAKQFATRVLGSLPGIKKYVAKDGADENGSSSIVDTSGKNWAADNFGMNTRGYMKPVHSIGEMYNPTKKDSFTNFGAQEAMRERVLTYPKLSFTDESDLNSLVQEINQHFKRVDDKMVFNQSRIIHRLDQLAGIHTGALQDKVIALNSQIEAGQEEFNADTVAKYFDIVKNYFHGSVQLILEAQNMIFERLVDDEINANDLDMARGFQLTRQLSKKLGNTLTEGLQRSLQLLPKEKKLIVGNNRVEDLKDVLTNSFSDSIRSLYLTARYGMHDKGHFNAFLDSQGKLDFSNPKKLFNQLLCIGEFQDATHGTVLQGRDFSEIGNEVAELRPQYVEGCVKELADNIVQKVILSYDVGREGSDLDQIKKDLEERQINIYNLRYFLQKIVSKEIRTYSDSRAIARDKIWAAFDMNPEKQAALLSHTYNQLDKAYSYLGQTNKEVLKGTEVKESSLFNLLTSNSGIDRHYSRIVLETSALACLDAIAGYRGWNESRVNGKLGEHKNFETMPWLKDVYESELGRYKGIIEKEQSNLKTAEAAEHLCDIANWLNKSGLFSGPEFFKRYGVEDLAKQMLKRMGELTNTGQMAINLRLYAQLFTFLDANDQSEGFSPLFLQRVKRLVKSLREVSTIYDDKNNIVYDPPYPNKFAKEKYQQLQKYIGSKAFLMNNVDLVTEFFQKCLENESVKKLKKGKDYSILDSKNLILATWLTYIVAKFLPEESTDTESMAARMKMFNVLANQSHKTNKELPRTLYPKMRGELFGVEADGKTLENNGRLGIVRSICTDLQKQLQAHCDPDARADLPLRFILENYQRVEEKLEANPLIKGKAERTHRQASPSGSMLQDLKSFIPSLLRSDPEVTVDFVKSTQDEDLVEETKRSILELISDISGNITSQDSEGYPLIELMDSNPEDIKDLIQALELTRLLGNLNNSSEREYVSLRTKDFRLKDEKDEANIKRQFREMQDLLSSRIVLRQDPRFESKEVAFSDEAKSQYFLKNKVLNLLKSDKFNILPRFGNTYQWMNDDQILRQLDKERALHPSKYKDSRDARANRQERQDAPKTLKFEELEQGLSQRSNQRTERRSRAA